MHALLFTMLVQPAGAEPFTFAVVGDTQGSGTLNYEVMPQLVEDMNAVAPDLVIFVGDLIGGYYTIGSHQAAWEEWVDVAAGLEAEVYAVPGNHDFFPGLSVYDAWLETFPWLPTDNSPPGQEGMTYHFDIENTRFVSVLTDSEWGQTSPDQDWLDAVLADPETQAMEHVVVYSHHPVSFSTAEPLGTTADPFWQSLVGNDVAVYFCGHWHRYQPSQLGNGGDTWETIIGTGGGSLYDPERAYQQIKGFQLVEVDGATMSAWFYGDEDGDGYYDDIMDEYVIAWESEAPTGLVGHWGFDEGTLEDDAPAPLGKAVHGEAMGGATIVDDAERGFVLELGGGMDGMEAGAIGDYNLSVNGDLTLSLFAKADAPGSGPWGQTLIAYGTADYDSEDEESNYSYWLSLVGGDGLLGYWEYENGWNVTVDSTAAVTDPMAWHHYALTRDADAMEATIWVDGEPLGDVLPFDRLPTGGGRGMLYLGRDVADSDGYAFDGRIDEVCVFNTLLEAHALEALAAGYDCFLDADGDGVDDYEGDCDDADPTAYPGAEEICDDGVDNDCNGEIDEVECDDTDAPDDTEAPGGDTGAEPADTGDGENDAEGCGCASAGTGVGWALLACVALVRRRREG